MKNRPSSTRENTPSSKRTGFARNGGVVRSGRTPAPWEKEWRGLMVDRELDDRWLEALNHLSGMRLTSICAGHPSQTGRREQLAHIVMQMGEHPGAGPGADAAWQPLLLDLARGFATLPGMSSTRIRLHQELTVRDGTGRDGPRIRIVLTLDCPAPRSSEQLSPDVRAWFEAACAGLARLDHQIAPPRSSITS